MTMTTQHTAKHDWFADGVRVLDADLTVITVCRQAKPLNTMTALRNARLIGAAPELLAALREVESWIAFSAPAEAGGLYLRITAAIAKAEGRTS